TARVFNVRTSERIRAATEVASSADVIAAAYQRLAPRVLDVPVPPGITLAGVGTTSAEALRFYVLGLQARELWKADSARLLFRRAVDLDSTFALAEIEVGGRYASAVRHS